MTTVTTSPVVAAAATHVQGGDGDHRQSVTQLTPIADTADIGGVTATASRCNASRQIPKTATLSAAARTVDRSIGRCSGRSTSPTTG